MIRTTEIKKMTTEQDLSYRDKELRWEIGNMTDAIEKIKMALPELSSDEDYSPAKPIDRTLTYLEEVERSIARAKEDIGKMLEGYRTLEFIERIEKELNS